MLRSTAAALARRRRRVRWSSRALGQRALLSSLPPDAEAKLESLLEKHVDKTDSAAAGALREFLADCRAGKRKPSELESVLDWSKYGGKGGGGGANDRSGLWVFAPPELGSEAHKLRLPCAVPPGMAVESETLSTDDGALSICETHFVSRDKRGGKRGRS